jgi:CheY-like chemotaxis protein
MSLSWLEAQMPMRARILVAEDEALAAMAVEDELQEAGYEVELAFDGQAALLAAQRALPDLLLTDLRMPRLDGSGLIRAVRAFAPGLPVVVMSGYVAATDADGFRRMGEGPVALFAKPLDMDALLAEIARLLQR